jgi:hypothetical protein
MENKAELFAALAKAQAEFGVAHLNCSNPFFKSRYADLTELVRVSRPALAKHGLSVLQGVVYQDGDEFLRTKLCHSSGQSEESYFKIQPIKTDAQARGSYRSYAARYEYRYFLGIVTSESEEDDGEAAMMRDKPQQASPTDKITKEQTEILSEELIGCDDVRQDILTKMKIVSIADMPKIHFSAALRRVREIKQLKSSK